MNVISEADLPTLPGDPDSISQSAHWMVSAMKGCSVEMADLLPRWKQLDQCLITPQTPQLLVAMAPLQRVIDEYQTSVAAVAKVMENYVEELSQARRKINDTREEIEIFHEMLKARPEIEEQIRQAPPGAWAPGYSPSPEVLANASHLATCSELHANIERISIDCASSLSAIGLPAGFTPWDGGTYPPSPPTSPQGFKDFLGQQLLNSLASKVGPNGDTCDLKNFLATHKDFLFNVGQTGIDANGVRAWWDGLPSGMAAALLLGGSKVTGALNGIPPNARVTANKQNAQDRLNDIADRPDSDPEKSYLLSVIAGRRKLYLYDHDQDQIIEMIGNPETAKRVITFVPGTTVEMKGFYDGGLQAASEFFVAQGAGNDTPTVAFVYKNGPWITFGSPWGERSNANKAWMMDRSADLAAFEHGIRSDPQLNSAQHVAIGHSAGLSIVTGAEVQGAHFDQVHSLSGSWIADGWKPQHGTHYHTYQRFADAINILDAVNASPGVHVIDDIGTPFSDPNWHKSFSPETAKTPLPLPLETAKLMAPLGPLGAATTAGTAGAQFVYELVENHMSTAAGPDKNGQILDQIMRQMRVRQRR